MEIDVTRRQGAFRVEAAFQGAASGVTALFGPSGAGKTSVIDMVAGLARPDRGRIRVNGTTLFDSERGVDLPPERRRIGYIFQDGRLFPHLSVKSNLTYGMGRRPAAGRPVDFDAVVDLLGIGHLLQRRPARLSGGEKQRVAIGRALLTRPALLLMDEPLASLDGPRKAEVLPFLSRLCTELSVPILYVSHSIDEILNLADAMVILDDGRVAAAGPIETVMNRADVQRRTGTDGIGAVIATIVEMHEDGLSRLRFAGGVMWVPRVEAPVGGRVRVRIAARNVGLALERPRGTSVQNIFAGAVESVLPAADGLVDVRLDIGCPLLARITTRALRDLALSPGNPVFALVKSVAVSLGQI